jgi:hypothetical protein
LHACRSKRLQMQVCIAGALSHDFTFCPAIQSVHSIRSQKQFDTMPFRNARFSNKQPKGELVL